MNIAGFATKALSWLGKSKLGQAAGGEDGLKTIGSNILFGDKNSGEQNSGPGGKGLVGALDASAAKGLGLTEQQEKVRGTISNVIGSFGPIGKGIQYGAKVLDWIGSKTGHAVTNISKDDATKAGINGARKVTNVLKSIPGLGLFLQGRRLTEGVSQDYELSNYGTDDYITGNFMFGSKGARNWNKNVQNWNVAKNLIGEQAELDLNNTAGELYSMQNANKYSGFKPNLTLAKHGVKFPELEEIRALLNKPKQTDTLEKFQLGGKMNIIPDGALHKNKNHLEEMDPDLEGQITTKGIPVVSTDENTGEVTQYAEIEKEEWTLCKEVTDKLEDLYKQYTENPSDEIAIECGKFIEEQLLRNTDDQANLRKEVV